MANNLRASRNQLRARKALFICVVYTNLSYENQLLFDAQVKIALMLLLLLMLLFLGTTVACSWLEYVHLLL